MVVRKSDTGRGLLKKAMAVPLSVVLAAGCAPTLAYAEGLAPASADLAGASVSSGDGGVAPARAVTSKIALSVASNSISPQALYLPVLLRAVGGIGEFEDAYQACGDDQWEPEYALFDTGNDGIPELLVRVSDVGGASAVHVYTVRSHEAVRLGQYAEGAGSSAGNDSGRLFVAGWNQGKSFVNEVVVNGDSIRSKFVASGQSSNDYFAKTGASWLEFADAAKFITLQQQGKYEISKAKVTVASAGSYTGAAKTPAVTVRFGDEQLTSGADFDVSYRNNVNAGTATVVVSGAGAYQGSKSEGFAIGRADIASAAVGVAAAGAYTGTAKAPVVSATFASRRLAANSDYKVSYRNNVNAGTATATVTGAGNFQGSKSVNFPISKAANSLSVKASGKTVKLSKVKAKAQTFSPVSLSKKGQGKVKYKNVSSKSVSKRFSVNSSTGAVTAKKGTGKGSYTVKIQVDAAGDGNFNAASKTVSSKVTVK